MNQERINAVDEPLKPPKDEDIQFIGGEKEKVQNGAMNAGENSKSFGEQVKHYERKIRAYNKSKDNACL